MRSLLEGFKQAALRPAVLVTAVICSAVFAVAAVYGGALAATGFLEGDARGLGLGIAGCFAVTLVVLLAVSFALCRWAEADRDDGDPSILGAVAPGGSRRSIVLHALVMLAAWSVVIVALFPGSMSWDTFYQIDQCYIGRSTVYVIPWAPTGSVVDAWFSDHHPIFDSLLFGLFALSSHALFHTWNYGVFAFVVLQSVATALAFTASVSYLERLGVPHVVRAVAFLFYCIMPFFPFYTATMMKDPLFACLFVPYLLMVCECARTRGSWLERRRNVIWFAALGVLLALTKKPGMYIVVITAIALAIAYRERWKALAVQVGSVLLVMVVVLPMAVFPLLHVIPGEKQETLGPLFQQTAGYALLHGDEVTDGERAAIDRVIGFDDLADRYDPFASDPVKFWYKYDTCTAADLADYLGVWARQGMRHPLTYLEATLATASGYFNLDGMLEVLGQTGDVEHGGSDLVFHPGELQPLWSAVTGAYGWLAGLPAAGVLFRVGVYAFVVPAVALVSLLMRRSGLAIVFVPIALSLLVCVVTPGFHARYAIALVYVAPFLAGLALSSARGASRRCGTIIKTR